MPERTYRETGHVTKIARMAAWSGVIAIVLLSIVPAEDRLVTGLGQTFEHFAAFSIVSILFALVYRLKLRLLLPVALLFCGGIELLQLAVPTRHARISDFIIDLRGRG